MRAEILSIGDELTSGQSLDTNSQWLSRQLHKLGIPVAFHATVGDNERDIVDALRIAVQRADIVITTGGLGPTADDVTRQALAIASDRPLELHQPSLEHIRRLIRRRGRQMPERNKSQAYFPRDSTIIHNPEGTAPGIDLAIGTSEGRVSRVVCLPGVPAELQQMWRDAVEPTLHPDADALQPIFHHVIRCFGAGESEVESRLPGGMTSRHRDPLVGITASNATISLRISTRATDLEEFHDKIRPTIDAVHTHLGNLVYGENDQQLHDVVLSLLKAANSSLGLIDCGLDGAIGQWLGEGDPEQMVFRGCISLPDQGARTWFARQFRGGKQSTMQLAQMARELLGSHFGMAIGELPAARERSSKAARIEVALAGGARSEQWQLPIASHPDLLRVRAAKAALNQLRLKLLED